MKKYAVDSAIQFFTKSILRPLVFREFTLQQGAEDTIMETYIISLYIISSLNLYSIGVRFDRNRPCNLFLIRCISGAKWTQIRHETDQKTEIRTNRSFTNVIFSRKENNKTKFSGRLHFRVTENILYKFMWIKTFNPQAGGMAVARPYGFE